MALVIAKQILDGILLVASALVLTTRCSKEWGAMAEWNLHDNPEQLGVCPVVCHQPGSE